MIKIKRIKVNFQVRFGYLPILTEFVKKLPKDQVQTKMQPINENGSTVEDWYRICNIAGLAKIIEFAKENNIPFKYENVKISDIEKIENFAANKQRKITAAKKLKAEGFSISEMDYSFMKLPPYEFQKEAVQFFEAVDGLAILGDQPGVGKTLSAIAYAIKNNLKTLVICPASLKFNWYDEIERFSFEKAHIFKYQQKKKDKRFNYPPEDSLIHIINYESLETYLKFEVSHKCENTLCDFHEVSLVKKYKTCPKCFKEKSVKSRNTDLCKFEDKKGGGLDIQSYSLVVLDEAHYIKSDTAQRTKIVKRAFHTMPRKLLLTGTAIKSKPIEFFTLLNFLDEYEWVNKHNFGVRYCDGKIDQFDHWNYDGYSHIDELYERISPLFLRRLKKDILKFLPPKTYTIIPIELSVEEAREYKKIEKGIIDETEESDEKMTHLARIQKLKQFTSKLNAERAVEFIQSIIDGDEKVVVFTQFLSTAAFLHETFKSCAVLFTGQKSATEKQQAIDLFRNTEECKVFVGTIGAAGVGITLTEASTLIFIDQPWVPADREQAEDRIHRASQTADKVQIIRLIAQGTIDEDIEELLNEKEKITSQVLDGKESTKEVKHSIFNDIVNIILNKKIF